MSALALAAGVVLAVPLAGAFGMGVDAASTSDMKAVGATPQYAQIWVGSWVLKSGWGSIDAGLREARDHGATPVIQYYYWGDSISVNGVKYGQDGRTKSQWFSLAKETATHAKNIMGDKPFLMVLEPEFNKNGIQNWEEFDGLLADMAVQVKNVAPKAKIVTGFGYWGGWDIFDRAVAKSDYVGFQLMRASTRDSSDKAIGAADQVISVSKALKAKFGKDIVVFDLAIGSYGGWEGVQEKSLRAFIDKRGSLDGAGVKVVVWRYLRDNDHSSGYFGAAESSWGVIRKDGSKKPAYDELVALIKGGTSTSSSGSSTTTTSSSGVFSNVKGNEWWIEAKVANSPKKVEARVNGGSWVGLAYKSWGAWAVSTHAPTGSTVELRATYSDGSTKSASFKWPDATPTTSTSSTSTSTTSTTSGSVFSNVKGNEWWIEAKVANSPKKVEARVNGGSWVALAYKSWGAWAVSTKAPTGSVVELRATYSDGSTKSASFKWPDATPTIGTTSGSTSTSSFSASYSGVELKEYWIEVTVKGTSSVSKVEARVNGGSWTALKLQSWGDWAASPKVPSGAKVEFRATSSSGATHTSGAYYR